MAKRGRKKGGFSINSLTDPDDIINKIINQTNSLNKKIKSFKNAGISEHERYLHSFLTDELVKYNKSGSISKSKKFYKDKHILWLKKTLSALVKANNNEIYGTVKKYQKEVNSSLRGLIAYIEKYLRAKGYAEDFIARITSSRDYLANIIMRFNEGAMQYGSNQIIDEVTLSYGEETGFSKEEIDKTLSNIEYSQNAIDRINDQMNEFEEWKRLKNKR